MPILLLTAALMPAASVSAQTQAFSPVDQAVADLDPLATSFRRIHPSLAVYNPNSSIYQIGGSDPLRNAAGSVDPRTGLAVPRNFVFEQPGVRVFLNRPDYLVLTNEDLRRPEFGLNVAPVIDRAFIELIPPGAVFDLVPRDDRTPLLIDEDDSAPDRRLGTPLRGLDRMGDPFDSDGLVAPARRGRAAARAVAGRDDAAAAVAARCADRARRRRRRRGGRPRRAVVRPSGGIERDKPRPFVAC